MTTDTNELDQGFSLADLADIDISDIEEVRFLDLPAGIYDWEVLRADLGEDTKDGLRRFKSEFELKILEVKAILEPGKNPDDFVGKTHTERFFIKPQESEDDVKKAIGRIKAFVADMGLSPDGKLKAVVDSAKGHIFTGKIVRQKDKNDPSHPGYARLRLEQNKN